MLECSTGWELVGTTLECSGVVNMVSGSSVLTLSEVSDLFSAVVIVLAVAWVCRQARIMLINR